MTAGFTDSAKLTAAIGATTNYDGAQGPGCSMGSDRVFTCPQHYVVAFKDGKMNLIT